MQKRARYIIIAVIVIVFAVGTYERILISRNYEAIKSTINTFKSAAASQDVDLANEQWLQVEDGGKMSKSLMQGYVLHRATLEGYEYCNVRVDWVCCSRAPVVGECHYSDGYVWPFEAQLKYYDGEWLIVNFTHYFE